MQKVVPAVGLEPTT